MVDCMFCKCFLESLLSKQSERNTETEQDDNETSFAKKCKNPLDNWETWLKIREDTNKVLSTKLNRRPGELLMNAAEEYRNVREEKILFENMKINTHFDKYRGNPAFWSLPPSIEEHCRTKCRKKCPCKDSVYFAVQTKAQKNVMPQIQYVSVSNYVLEEKNVLPRTRNIYALWKKNPYRKTVLNRILAKLTHLEPHRPDNSSLIVLGNQKISAFEKIDDQKATDIDDLCEGMKKASGEDDTCESDVEDLTLNWKSGRDSDDITFKVHDIDMLNFTINGKRISQSIMEQGSMKVRILFELDELPEVPIVNNLKLVNHGKVALRIQFVKYEKYVTFRDIIPTISKPSPFYFDMREMILLPGKNAEFPIWFKPTRTGHFFETWKVRTKPKFWDDPIRLLVLLQGIVYKEDFREKAENIRDMLSLRVRNTLINDVIRGVLDATKYQTRQIKKYTYSERHYFEAINQEYWGVNKRPKYLYNKYVINELKEFYKQRKMPQDEPKWNYSIKRLQEIARKKDVLDYVDNLYKKCEKGRTRAKYLQKLYDASSVNFGQVKPEVVESATSFDKTMSVENTTKKETNYGQLNKLLQKLERPVMINNTDREKYANAYYVFRFYLLKGCKELSGSFSLFVENIKPPSRIEEVPERLLFEKFDDIWIERKRRVPPVVIGGFPCKPKPKSLEEVPLDAPELIYSKYFNKPVPGKAQKGKHKKDKKDTGKNEKPVNQGKKGKRKNSEAETPLEKNIEEGFDPFADFPISAYDGAEFSTKKSLSTNRSSRSIQSKQSKKSEEDICAATHKSYYEKYLIVYNSLCTGIDAMVAALETMKDTAIPIQILSELANCNIVESGGKLDTSSMSPKQSIATLGKEQAYVEGENENNFDYLMRKHLLHNQKTQDYFIRGKTLPVVESEITRESTSIKQVESFQLFKPRTTLSIGSANFKSGEMQTSTIDDDQYEPFSNILLEEELIADRLRYEGAPETDTTLYEQDTQSSEIFYFVDNGI